MLGLVGTGDQTRDTCVASSGATRLAIHYNSPPSLPLPDFIEIGYSNKLYVMTIDTTDNDICDKWFVRTPFDVCHTVNMTQKSSKMQKYANWEIK
jgi:hypothetical protein